MTMSSSSVGAAATPRTQAAPSISHSKVDGVQNLETDRVEGKRNLDVAPEPHVGKDGASAAGNQGLSNMSLPGQSPQAAPTTSDEEYVQDCTAIDAAHEMCEQNVFDTEDEVNRDIFAMP